MLPDQCSIEPETFCAISVRKRTYLMGSNQSLSFESGSTVHYDEVAEYEMDTASPNVRQDGLQVRLARLNTVFRRSIPRR